jgi:hypothetical protein
MAKKGKIKGKGGNARMGAAYNARKKKKGGGGSG